MKKLSTPFVCTVLTCWVGLLLLVVLSSAWTQSEQDDEHQRVLNQALREINLEQLDTAWQILSDWLAQQPSDGDVVKLGGILVTMSEIARRWGEQFDSAKALPAFEDCLEVAQSLALPRVELRVLGNRARLYTFTGHPALAREDLQRALTIARTHNDRPSEVRLNLSLAALYQQTGFTGEAIAIYEKLLNEAGTDASWAILKAGCHVNLGVIAYRQQRFGDAAVHYNQALALLPPESQADQQHRSLSGAAFNNLAQIAIKTQQYGRANDYLQQALRIRSELEDLRGVASVTYNQAEAAFGQEQTELAQSHYRSALEKAQNLGIQSIQVDGLTGLGKVALANNELNLGRELLSQAMLMATRIADPFRVQQVLVLFGDLELAAGAKSVAREYFMQAIEQIESMARSLPSDRRKAEQFWTAHDETFQKVIELLTELGEINEALDLTLRRNAFRYELSATQDTVAQDPEAQQALDEYRQAQQNLADLQAAMQEIADQDASEGSGQLAADLQRRYSEAQGRFLDMADQLARENPTVYEGLGIHPSRAVLMQSALQAIAGNSAIVTYVLTGNPGLPLVAFIVKPNDLAFVSIAVEEAALERRVLMLHNMIGSPAVAQQIRYNAPSHPAWERELFDHSAWLYHVLIGSIATHIADVDTVAVIPDKILSYLPFAVLGHRTSTGWKWLMEEKNIVYLRGQSLEDMTAKLQTDTVRAMALANADGTLPFTENEVLAVAEAYPDAKIFVRHEASEDKVKYDPNNSNLLHFGTHAVLDPEDPENSHLVLAPSPDGSEDGRLTLREIRRLEGRQGALVTLSACQTSVSAESVGQELVHLERAFRLIGARTIIASLWPVDDEATALIMRSFYRNMKDGMPVGQALNRAQRVLVQDPEYNFPFYWAPFVLVGSWQ